VIKKIILMNVRNKKCTFNTICESKGVTTMMSTREGATAEKMKINKANYLVKHVNLMKK
jgi:hypothetical protein